MELGNLEPSSVDGGEKMNRKQRRKLKSKKKGASVKANPRTKENIQTALRIVRDD